MQIKVLYIEDELSLAKIVKESLQGRSFDVLHLENGANVVNEYAEIPTRCMCFGCNVANYRWFFNWKINQKY